MAKKKKIALLTSGGDAPGMNAAIRSIVRNVINMDHVPIGITRGYQGLLNNEFLEMNSRSVSNIIQNGGTMLKTSRCRDFKTSEGLRRAAENLEQEGISGMVVIGGDGSYRGAYNLSKEWAHPIVGVPGTIDNDIFGTDYTIGYDTAVNTALCAIDKIRDTAESHERFFVVEVMGRNSGHIALTVGTACGAEYALIPEIDNDLNEIADQLLVFHQRGKKSIIIVVAEGAVKGKGGAVKGNIYEMTETIRKRCGIRGHVVVLGHIQRGGVPSAFDRNLATQLGYAAAKGVIEGRTNVCVGIINEEITFTDMPQAWTEKKPLPPYFLEMMPVLRK